MLAFVDDKTLQKVAEAFGGEEAVQIVNVLKQVGETTDDVIAEQTEIRLNTVRKILYKLYDHSLVGLRRSRDKNTGWFIFHWRLQLDQLAGFISNQKHRVLEKLETRLAYEQDHDFYYCGTEGCKRVTFEEAMELVFRCPTCNKLLMHFDNTEIKECLKKRVEELRKELGE
ncbi:MAG TPA: transcription factor [Candidatus Bathyarchaeota archaeon]|nr:transcription factor [Candidatus Bathyarchaeota archaeon]